MVMKNEEKESFFLVVLLLLFAHSSVVSLRMRNDKIKVEVPPSPSSFKAHNNASVMSFVEFLFVMLNS